VPPLVAATAGLAVLLGGSAVALAPAVLAGRAWWPVALVGVVASGLAALVAVTRVAFGGRR
jgi:hypothetical protein